MESYNTMAQESKQHISCQQEKPSRQKDRPEVYRPMPTPRAWPDQSRPGITRFHMPKKAKPYYRKSRRPLRREQESQQTNPPQPALDDGTGPEDQHRLAKMPGDGGHHQPEGGRQVLDTLRTTCTTIREPKMWKPHQSNIKTRAKSRDE